MDPAVIEADRVADRAADQPEDDVALQVRRDVPVTVAELAALGHSAIEIIDVAVQILTTLRRAALRRTSPEDWVLFKAGDEHGGQIVGYLEDAGCDRVAELYGINITNLGRYEKVTTEDPAVFYYTLTGDGYCNRTGRRVLAMEGMRASTDDFCKDLTSIARDMAVRKAARANLDGGIVRELAGMKSVPLDELKAAWEGCTPPKSWERCRLGRGFGSARERLGASNANAPDVEPPKCGVCGTVAKWRPANANGPAFYGCPKYKEHPDRKWSIKADEWIAQQKTKPIPVPQAGAPAAPPPAAATPVVHTEIPWGSVQGNRGARDPGQEG